MYMLWFVYFLDVSISKWSFRCNFPVFKSLNKYVPKSTKILVYPLNGPSSALMTLSENYIFNPNHVDRSRPKIISYLPLSESYTWQLHVATFVALSAGKVKSIWTLRLLVIFLACVLHCIGLSFSGYRFSIRLSITIVELNPLSSIIWNF